MDVLEQLNKIALVPVIAIDDASNAVDLAKALISGGLPCAEITFRTKAGRDAIKNISENVKDCLVGAGTILTLEQAKQAYEAGAKFIVSPGLNIEVLKWCNENDILHIPGCVTPTEMTCAVNNGAKVVKVFPAENVGGLKYIKSVSSVFPLKFMPTGGINASNLEEYLSYEKVCACGGTWLAKKDMINGKKWDEISKNCMEAVEIIKKCRKV